MKTTKATLCFLLNKDTILLGYKKRGFGMGKWNGVGGKVNKDETPLAAAIRETKEEIGVDVTQDIQEIGIIEFEYRTQTPEKVLVFVYFAEKWIGEVVETDEILPKWFKFKDIPYDLMWPDDRFWLPRLIEKQKIYDFYAFDDKMQIVECKTGNKQSTLTVRK